MALAFRYSLRGAGPRVDLGRGWLAFAGVMYFSRHIYSALVVCIVSGARNPANMRASRSTILFNPRRIMPTR